MKEGKEAGRGGGREISKKKRKALPMALPTHSGDKAETRYPEHWSN